MIIYRKKSDKKLSLATQAVKRRIDTGRCPSCGKPLELVEAGKDRNTFHCQNCNSTSTFTKLPIERTSEEPKTKRLGALTLRDRTTPAYRQSENVDAKPLGQTGQQTIFSVRDCMQKKSLVSFSYIVDKKKATRIVEPYKLCLQNGEPILYGYDVESGGIRIFKVAKMDNVESQNYSFEPKWPIEDKLISEDPSDGRTETAKEEAANRGAVRKTGRGKL